MMARMASVVKTAAVTPAAKLLAPPSRLADVIYATAAAPSASVDTPMSVVNSPHTMNSTPTKSTCDGTAVRD